MRIIPAIDVLDGAAVRLTRGDYDDVTVYSDDPGTVASTWSAAGVSLIHAVDLEAARTGTRQLGILAAIAGHGADVQLGGGIRTAEDAQQVVGAGASRVVLGSVLVDDETEVERITGSVGPDRVVAAIDVRQGRARGSGWLDEGITVDEMAGRVARAGIRAALATGIERDGTMDGPDTALLEHVRNLLPDIELIASGGVGTLADLEYLASSGLVDGAIVGRALYEGRFSLLEALATGVSSPEPRASSS
ncbi:MAG: HisA/HisF-related TIM barrel protein [Acidimicrobiia bacterium]